MMMNRAREEGKGDVEEKNGKCDCDDAIILAT